MNAVSSKAKFMSALNNSFGSGGMSLAFNETQFASFIQFLKDQNSTDMDIKVAAHNVGLQPCGKVWVLGKSLQIDSDGKEIDATKHSYLWLPDIIPQIGNITMQRLLPTISLPLTTTSLSKVVALLKITMQHNFYASLLMMAGCIMSLHYKSIVNRFNGCPSIVAEGPSETGKSTALKVALTLTGESAWLYVRY